MAEKRTYKDRAPYLIAAVKRRRKQLREKAIAHKGGRCVVCGYNRCMECLDFHHIDPQKKDFGLSSRGITRSWEKIKKEINKCILICSRCHGEIHAGITQLPRVSAVEKRGENGETL